MEILINGIHYFLLVANAAMGVLVSFVFVHRLQLESYQGRMYLKGVWRYFLRDCLPLVMLSLVNIFLDASALFLYAKLGAFGHFIYTSVVRLLVVIMQLWLYIDWRRVKAKKPLAFTPRTKRLVALLSLIFLALQWLTLAWLPWNSGVFAYLFIRSAFVWGALFMPLWVLAAYLLLYPFERLNNRRYFHQARRILLQHENLVKIGITGSFGKTSMKMILGALLKEKYNVLVPEGSINTPMGLTRVIREQLDESHEVFIAEMGARYKGDIAELCELVQPDTAIITAVGEQHLETFGTLDNVIKEKFSLIEALPQEGKAFFNADNDICRALYDAAQIGESYLYGAESQTGKLDVRAENVRCTSAGSEFTLVYGGERESVKTRLLGRHNIVNIVGAADVALHMGLSLQEVASSIAKLEPVQHRLQLIEGAVTVIDDAFNSNPAGAKAALEVLASFEGRKIVITPGMVELGDKEAELNRAFGAQMAGVANYVILVGEKRTKPIHEGLIEAGFDGANIAVTPSLQAATEKMAELTRAGDVVLFENDLPDNYTE